MISLLMARVHLWCSLRGIRISVSDFLLLSCTWLLAWVLVRNTGFTVIYTPFSGRDQAKLVHSCLNRQTSKDSPIHGNKIEHLCFFFFFFVCVCVNESKCLKIILMTAEWAEIILPIIPLHFPMMVNFSNCL